MASGVTKMEISVAPQVRAKRKALAFTQFTAPPDFHNTKLLREELAIFLSAFSCNQQVGEHGFIPMGLSKEGMQLLTANNALACTAIAKPDLVNPLIMAETGRDLFTLQEEQSGLWSDYLYQRVLNQVGREIIVSVIPEKYIKTLYNQYLGYNGVTIHQFLQQKCTWVRNYEQRQVED